MKKQLFSVFQTCLLILAIGFSQTSQAQTPFTISWTGLTGGSIAATGVPTGITVVQQYNGVVSNCSTSSNGGTATYSAIIQASPGYTVTITSIGGAAYASNAGSRNYVFQLTNGGTYTQGSQPNIGATSNCGSPTTLATYTVPAAGQTLNAGSQATISVLKTPGSSAGTGYGLTSKLTVTGVVTPICNTPTGLSASNVTSSTADLSWNAVSGSSGYQYVIDQVSANPSGAGTATSLTTYNATSLTPSTTYYLHVRNTCGGSNFSSWATIPFTTTAAPCSVPTNLAENNVTATSADFNWDAMGSNNFEYVLDQTYTDPAGAGTAINGVSFSTSSLTPATTYYFHLRQNCGGSFSNWVMVNFTTPVAPCDAPTGLAATNTTHNSSDLSWNAQGAASTYEYVVDQFSTNPTSGTSTTGTTYNATGLTPSTTYYLHVRTNCVQGNSSAWTTSSFTTAIAPCDAPTGLAAANTTHNSADLSWNAQVAASTYEYIVDQVSTDPTSGTSTSVTTYNATGLTPSTTYYLHVRTNCVQGNTSAWTTISFTTAIAPCDAPTGLTAANTTHNSSDLSWNAQGAASTYEYVVDQFSTNPTSGTSTTGTTYSASGLTPSTTYYLHVRTNCVQGNTSAWTTSSFTTAIAPCDAPTGLAAANITHNSADLSWNTQGAASTYEYVVDQTSTDPTSGTSTTGTTYSANGLTPSTTYYLHVRTNCVQGNTSAWTAISFTTAIAPCDAPTGLAATDITHNSADLSWNTQGAASTYEYVIDQVSTNPTAGTSISGTIYNATGLTPFTTYYLHVRTNCVQGNTSAWTTISFMTLVQPCDAPTGLAAANTTHNSSDISWDMQGSNTFEYVLDQTATDPGTIGTPITATSYNPTTLTPETTYYFHLRTDCSGTNFSPWITISFTTAIEPCDAPTGLNAANMTNTSADLSWNAQGSNAFEYVLDEISTDPATAGTSTTGTTYNATSLTPSTVYYLHVRTDCVQGNTSDWTTYTFTTPAASCDAPTGLNATNTTSNSSDLSWNIQGGNSFEYVLDQLNADPATSGTATTATSYSATSLNASTTYYLHVRTDCGNGNYSDWTTISFTTDAALCAVPTGLTASNVAGHSANLAWGTQAGNTFEYVLNQTSGNPATSGTATANNTFAATSLTGSTTYYFHVRTNCGNGNFSDWTTVSFTTVSTAGLDESEMVDLAVYPNPTNDVITITGQTQGTITLINVKGQQLAAFDLEQQTTFDLSGYESGIYFIRYRSENKVATIKVVKQ